MFALRNSVAGNRLMWSPKNSQGKPFLIAQVLFETVADAQAFRQQVVSVDVDPSEWTVEKVKKIPRCFYISDDVGPYRYEMHGKAAWAK